ncbi:MULTISPECIES: LysR family transcriptional regulator [Stenotrophomonas]|uniref:LysR family transcriptional regulator n=1 Tax=Stenotrophomonas maltophilia TaxID=40324 RepID=A0A431UDQ5_STEMA|nr:LysR family transcriptional regulator [Stenotrophomonas maltophilia]RTQ87610.1 LysR family transcriptional regulator [Stenotrophomonas maltophilia]
MLLDLNDLQYFVLVVDHGGFSQAGRALGIPKSNLSRRISLLEQRLGVRLIVRNTRHFRVTDIGHTYYSHCRAMLVEAEAAEEAIEVIRAEPRGVVRITCPVTLLEERVGDMVTDFMALHPLIEVHLESTDRRVDVVGEGIDVALRVRPPRLEDSELAIRVLSGRSQCLVASPALLEHWQAPREPMELGRLPSLHHGAPQQDYAWTLFGPDGARIDVPHQPRLVTRGMPMLRSAAVAGIGVVQMPTKWVHAHLDRGELIQLLPEWTPRREIIHAVFPSRRGLLPSVRALIDFLALRFKDEGLEAPADAVPGEEFPDHPD